MVDKCCVVLRNGKGCWHLVHVGGYCVHHFFMDKCEGCGRLLYSREGEHVFCWRCGVKFK